MLKFLLHSDSLFGKVLTIISTIVIMFFIIVVITDNPFSQYTYIDEVEEERPVSMDQIQFDSDRSYFDYIDKENNRNIYILSKESKPIFNPKNPKELKVIATEMFSLMALQEYYFLSIDKISDYNIHPIKPLKYTKQGDLLILGTTSSGNDLLSTITASVSKTFVLMFYTMASFLFFGIISGVLIGYYRERFVRSIGILEFTIKTIESTPLILWMLLSVIIIQGILIPLGIGEDSQLKLIFGGSRQRDRLLFLENLFNSGSHFRHVCVSPSNKGFTFSFPLDEKLWMPDQVRHDVLSSEVYIVIPAKAGIQE